MTIFNLAQFYSPAFQFGLCFLTSLLDGLKRCKKLNYKINKVEGKETQD